MHRLERAEFWNVDHPNAASRVADGCNQGHPQRGPRPLFVASDVLPRPPAVGGLPIEALPGGHTKPRVAHRPIEAWAFDHAALRGDELKVLGPWLKQCARMKPTGKTFFVSEQRRPLHRSTVNLLLNTTGSKTVALPFLAHPPMLRHVCGFAVADQEPIPGSSRIISDIGTFSTPSGTPPQAGKLRAVAAVKLHFDQRPMPQPLLPMILSFA
jgi:hypothetical protein